MAPTPVILPEESHGQRSLEGCMHSSGKESACSAGDPGSNPWSGRSPGEGNDKPLQYSCLENPMDREPVGNRPWYCKNQTQLSD